MKKLLFLFVAAALAACNTEDEEPAAASVSRFDGTLTVTSNGSPDAEPYILTDAIFEIGDGESGTTDLTMSRIRFAESMPMALTIVIPDLGFASGAEQTKIYSNPDPIVPYIGGKPYSAFEIPDFEGSYSNGVLRIVFVCRNPAIPVGDGTLDHTARFEGTLLQ